ncbi:hypothetical protein B0H13DRAFT_2065285 [Mycena leptocephala]|nr:hypothetical protein B0H13DRAFT_2065285 [Mycena leptocephala]
MFALKVGAVLAAMLATIVHSTPAAQATSPVPSLKGAPHADAALAIVIMHSCDDPSLSGICFDWRATVTSVSAGPGLQCTLFADSGCTGRSQLVVGTINDLGTVGFDNTASSFFCAST